MDFFKRELYVESLQEISFLQEARASMLDDPGMELTDLAELDARIEALFDVLVLGEELAISVARERALEGDAGERHGALRLFLRARRPELVEELRTQTDTDDADEQHAIFRALRCELDETWTPWARAQLETTPAPWSALVAEAAGRRRLDVGKAARAAADRAPVHASFSSSARSPRGAYGDDVGASISSAKRSRARARRRAIGFQDRTGRRDPTSSRRR